MPYPGEYYAKTKGRLAIVKLKFVNNKYCIGIVDKVFDTIIVLDQCMSIQHVKGTTLVGYYRSPQTFIAPGEENATIEWARSLDS